MVQSVNPNSYPGSGQYFTVAASQTNQVIGLVGAVGDYLDSILFIPGSVAPGVVVVKDGTTAIITTTVGTATVMPGVFSIPIKAYSKLGTWNITTGASVSLVVTGQFT